MGWKQEKNADFLLTTTLHKLLGLCDNGHFFDYEVENYELYKNLRLEVSAN